MPALAVYTAALVLSGFSSAWADFTLPKLSYKGPTKVPKMLTVPKDKIALKEKVVTSSKDPKGLYTRLLLLHSQRAQPHGMTLGQV